MPIKVKCQGCGVIHEAADELRGRRVRCKCGFVFQVGEKPAARPAKSSLEELLDVSADEVGAPLFGTVTSDSGAPAGEPSITVEAPEQLPVRRDLLLALLQYCAWHHLTENHPRSAAQCRLLLEVERCVVTDNVVELRLALSGQVEGCNVHRQFKASRRRVAIHAGVLGGVVGVVGAALVSRAISHIAGVNSLDRRVLGVVQEVMADVCLFLDQQLGRRDSNISRLYQNLQLARRAVAGAVLLSVAVTAAKKSPQPVHLGQLLLFSLLPAAASFFAAHAAILACMPSSFLSNDPRGQKAMARSGVQSVAAMRVVAVVLALVLLLVTVGSSVVCVMSQVTRN